MASLVSKNNKSNQSNSNEKLFFFAVGPTTYEGVDYSKFSSLLFAKLSIICPYGYGCDEEEMMHIGPEYAISEHLM